jgi:peptidyl-prolyl cis-trans isomerase D
MGGRSVALHYSLAVTVFPSRESIMLQAMRRHAGSWVAKGFLLLLAASFGLWGVGDIFSGYRDPVVAEVGGRDIHASAFFDRYNQRLSELRRSLGGAVDESLIRQLGLPEQVLNDMARRLLIRVEVAERGLTAGQQDLGTWLQDQEMFRNSLGQFDRNLFTYAARAQGLQQEEFLALLGELRTSELLLDAVSSGAQPPDRWVRAFHALERERRRARAAVFLATDSDAPAPAEDEAVRARHADQGERYQTPHRRHLSYAVLDPDALKDAIAVSEDELAEAFEQRRDEYFETERRQVRQYLADSRDEADRVLARAREGTGLAAAVEEILGEAVTELGLVAREELDADYADAVFSAGADTVHGPAETTFGWRVFEVADIQAARAPSLDDIRDTLTDALQLERAFDLLHERAEVFYDERAGNASLEEAARASGAAVATVTDIDAQGRDNTGAAHPDAPDRALLALGFNVNAGATSDLEELDDGRMVAVRVDQDIPARVMTLDEARADILEDLAEEARLADARARAEAYATATSGTASLSALATVHGGVLHTSDSFTRNGEGAAADFPEVARQVAFELEAGATSDAQELGGGYVVVTLDEVVPASDPTSDDLAAGHTALGAALGSDVVNSFIASLWTEHQVRINQTVLDRVLTDNSGTAN